VIQLEDVSSLHESTFPKYRKQALHAKYNAALQRCEFEVGIESIMSPS
jgi:hypothetical protein